MFCLNEFSLSGFSVCHGCALAQSVCVVVCACVYFRVCVCVCVCVRRSVFACIC